MARVTVEDCLKNVVNRFELIHMAAKRVRQLRKGAEPLVASKNKDIVVSLREIAAGKVFEAMNEEGNYLIADKEDSVPKELPEQTEEESPSQEQGDQEAMPEGK